jgi:hypothetical protein
MTQKMTCIPSYIEHDPRVLSLPDTQYRYWTKLVFLAAHAEPWGALPPLFELSQETKIAVERLRILLNHLESLNLIRCIKDGSYMITLFEADGGI